MSITEAKPDSPDKVEKTHNFEQNILRDGYRYILNAKYKDKLFYKCEDKKHIGCKGVWKLYLTSSQEIPTGQG